MRKLPPEIQELISTPIRERIFQIINSQKEGFTFLDIHQELEHKQVDVSLTSVQNFIKSLSYRGYLKEYPLKESKTAGRSTIHFKISDQRK